MEERAAKTDAIITALATGRKVEHILKEETNATHDDLCYVEEQKLVLVTRDGLGNSRIIYSLEPKGRDVLHAGGLLNYLDSIRLDKEKLLEKADLEKQIAILQKNKLEYEQNMRYKEAEIKRLQTENLLLSTTHLTNQNEIHPINKALKYADLFKIFLNIAAVVVGAIIEHNTKVLSRLIAILSP